MPIQSETIHTGTAIVAELRRGNKPSLNEALGWIGSRVDDIYGANVGRLEDVWVDPGTRHPSWLLVREGRLGGGIRLIPFEDAAAGAGRVWVPYEREVVRDAPPIEFGVPLTRHVAAALRAHYAATTTAPAPRMSGNVPPRTGTDRFAVGSAGPVPQTPPQQPADFEFRQQHARDARAAPRRHVLRAKPEPPPRPTVWPPLYRRDVYAPAPFAPPQAYPYSGPQSYYPPPVHTAVAAPVQLQPPATRPAEQVQVQAPVEVDIPATPPANPKVADVLYAAPEPEAVESEYAPEAALEPEEPEAVDPMVSLSALAEAGGTHYVELELSGELTIRGELHSVRVIPHEAS